MARRRRLGRDRRRAEGVAGRQRGDLDDHAQRHRHRRARVPARRTTCARRTRPATSSRRPRLLPPSAHPAAQPVPRLFGFDCRQHRAQRLPRRRRPRRRRASTCWCGAPASASTCARPGATRRRRGRRRQPEGDDHEDDAHLVARIAGLVGLGPLLGDPQFHVQRRSSRPAFGFTGIAVALLGRNHPVGIAFSALLFGLHRASDPGRWRCRTSRKRSRRSCRARSSCRRSSPTRSCAGFESPAEVRARGRESPAETAAGGAGGAIPEPVPA